MISVIILTRNRNYNVLEAAENGRLVIMEKHLICGIVQNGVKCIPYGNVLNAFETFLTDNTLSVEMIPSGVWMPEGRVLDFSNIELLQLSTTIPLSQSGSVDEFESPVFTESGFPIVQSLRLKGANFQSRTAVENFFNFENDGVTANAGQTLCNKLTNEDSGTQLISIHNYPKNLRSSMLSSFNITEVYDLSDVFETRGNTSIHSSLKVAVLPNLTGTFETVGCNVSGLEFADFRGLTHFDRTGNAAAIAFNNQWKLGINLTVSSFMQTSNAGGMDATIAHIINDRQGNVTFV